MSDDGSIEKVSAVWFVLVVLVLVSILSVQCEQLLVSSVSDKLQLAKRVGNSFLTCIQLLVCTITFLLHYSSPDNKSYVILIRLFDCLSILFSSYLIWAFVQKSIDSAYRAQSQGKQASPQWFRNLWKYAIIINCIFLLICEVVSLIVGNLFALWLFDLLEFVVILVAGCLFCYLGVRLRQGFASTIRQFKVYNDHIKNKNNSHSNIHSSHGVTQVPSGRHNMHATGKSGTFDSNSKGTGPSAPGGAAVLPPVAPEDQPIGIERIKTRSVDPMEVSVINAPQQQRKIRLKSVRMVRFEQRKLDIMIFAAISLVLLSLYGIYDICFVRTNLMQQSIYSSPFPTTASFVTYFVFFVSFSAVSTVGFWIKRSNAKDPVYATCVRACGNSKYVQSCRARMRNNNQSSSPASSSGPNSAHKALKPNNKNNSHNNINNNKHNSDNAKNTNNTNNSQQDANSNNGTKESKQRSKKKSLFSKRARAKSPRSLKMSVTPKNSQGVSTKSNTPQSSKTSKNTSSSNSRRNSSQNSQTSGSQKNSPDKPVPASPDTIEIVENTPVSPQNIASTAPDPSNKTKPSVAIATIPSIPNHPSSEFVDIMDQHAGGSSLSTDEIEISDGDKPQPSPVPSTQLETLEHIKAPDHVHASTRIKKKTSASSDASKNTRDSTDSPKSFPSPVRGSIQSLQMARANSPPPAGQDTLTPLPATATTLQTNGSDADVNSQSGVPLTVMSFVDATSNTIRDELGRIGAYNVRRSHLVKTQGTWSSSNLDNNYSLGAPVPPLSTQVSETAPSTSRSVAYVPQHYKRPARLKQPSRNDTAETDPNTSMSQIKEETENMTRLENLDEIGSMQNVTDYEDGAYNDGMLYEIDEKADMIEQPAYALFNNSAAQSPNSGTTPVATKDISRIERVRLDELTSSGKKKGKHDRAKVPKVNKDGRTAENIKKYGNMSLVEQKKLRDKDTHITFIKGRRNTFGSMTMPTISDMSNLMMGSSAGSADSDDMGLSGLKSYNNETPQAKKENLGNFVYNKGNDNNNNNNNSNNNNSNKNRGVASPQSVQSQQNVFENLEQYKGNAKRHVSLIIYEFDHVLVTMPEKFNKMDFNKFYEIDPFSLLMTFGGEERVQALTAHFNNISEASRKERELREEEEKEKNSNASGSVMGSEALVCFVFTRRHSDTVYRILDTVGLIEYFRHFTKYETELSHVVGFDHRLMQENSFREHLVLLKLIRFLQKEHNNVLYIGSDKDTIDHLNKINVCQTYLVKTKGLTQKDLDKIEKKFFNIKKKK